MKEIAAVVIMHNDKALILKRSDNVDSMTGLWNLPGGHVEPHESAMDAAEREAQEEAGITPHEMILLTRRVSNDVLCDIFLSILPVGHLELNAESSDSAWITEQEIPYYAFIPGVAEALHQAFRSTQSR